MDDKKDVTQESSPETEVEVEETTEEITVPEEVKETVSEDVKPPTPSEPVIEEEKTVPFGRFKEVNDKLTTLQEQSNKSSEGLDVEDYIDISTSLEGLDKTEKEYLARQHKLTQKPLKEIREGEDYKLWQVGHNAQVEKELALKPSGTQPDSDRPKSLTEKLRGASRADKEKLLVEAGLYKSPRPKIERTRIE